MAYSFDRIPNRRTPGVLNKWTWFPQDILPMWVADMDFAAPPPILKAFRKFAEHGDLGYQLPSRALYETIAARMEKLYRWKISADMIVTVAGVNIGYNVAARTFCTSRRGYMIQTPVYNEFHETQKKTNVPKVEAPLLKSVKGNRISYEVDYDALERAAKKVNLFLLCNPHNPVGKIFSQSDLKRMAEICIRNDVLIVSDEIHSELLLDGNRFRPLASLNREIANRTITLVSASKAFNVPGLFCAFAIIPNQELRRRYEETVLKMGIHVGSPGLVASRIAYSGQCDRWLAALRRYLTDNREFILDDVTRQMPTVRVTIPQATYLAWLDFSQMDLGQSPYDFFLKNAKVAMADGMIYGENGAGHVRLNFGTSRRILKQGLDRMRKALEAENLV
ncbi:MAG TPA: PatB family C-S lyase [Anaerolineales bacterium]|nr:PatB family C-S lyase [Anaerolineales bacterium]